MNIVDLAIVLFLIIAVIRGYQIGFVRQFFSTAGFFGGLLLGAWLQPHVVPSDSSAATKSLLTLLCTIGLALLVMSIGEYAGVRLKQKILQERINKADNTFGSVLAMVSLLLIVWFTASIFSSLPVGNLKSSIDHSRIVGLLTRNLPATPGIIAKLDTLIDPNGFPQVFTGHEPTPSTTNTAATLSGFETAIAGDQASVVKLEGQGCGGIVEGSGFVAAAGLIITNAHVVAGISRPYVEDSNGTHRATAIWFDPNLDIAVLRVSGLAGQPLSFGSTHQAKGTAGAVLGYPGGGSFTASGSVILDEFIATGRNIYGQGSTARDVYEVKSHIIPGNSGGPLINKDGQVIGVVFAQSTSYQNVGYTLNISKVESALRSAEASNSPVSTGNCAE